MKDYKCIIFDCDGVLVDSEPLGNGVLVEMANEQGATIDLNYAYWHFKGGSYQSVHDHIEKLIGKKLPPDFEPEYRRRSFEAFTKHLKPVEGIENVLNNLEIPFCVASSGPQTKIRHNLRITGLLKYFESNIFSCYDVGKWKPEPEVFLHAAKTMGFSPNECLVIEDTPIGLEAAKRGGFDVYGYADKYSYSLFEKEATGVFTHMDHLKQMLTKKVS